MSDDADLTYDAFLGGHVRLWQPKTGYRAGIDPVLLAASVPARAGQAVLELGCGVGAVSLCLAARVPGLTVTGLEIQERYADLARRNARENEPDFEVITGDLAAPPPAIKSRRFDHVIANPPYFDAARRTSAKDSGREAALAEATPLATWVDMAARRLAPKGYAHIVLHAERLPDLLTAVNGRLGSIEVLPFSARQGRAPQLVILRGRKGGQAPFCLHAPMVLHIGPRHERDGEGYHPEFEDIFRNAAALNWPDR